MFYLKYGSLFFVIFLGLSFVGILATGVFGAIIALVVATVIVARKSIKSNMILDEIAKHTLRFFVATVTVFMILFYIAMSLLEGVSLLYGLMFRI